MFFKELIKPYSKVTMLEKIFLLGVGVTNVSEDAILEYILQSLEKKDQKYYIVTPNPEILVYATKHKDFKNILNNARLALCDGTGLVWASRFVGKKLRHRVTGTDLVKSLCFAVSKRPITVGFLGGGPGVAEKTAECLVAEHPGLKVVFASSESDELLKPLKNPKSLIDILFVAYGFPKQEEWMARNLDKIPVKVAIGVGGAFDYISGRVIRAPKFIQALGLEWLFRLIRQPWRLKRQLALLKFIFLILKEKLRK